MKNLYQASNTSLNSLLKNNLLIPRNFRKLPFEKIKNDILGKRYELSIVFIGEKRSKNLNTTYGKKNKATDVLSFPFSSLVGEIFINPQIAKIKSIKFCLPYENYLFFLVIHAILHLKGMRHGANMERYELKYYSRYRCGNL